MTDVESQRMEAICEIAGVDAIGDLSDGFHTFNSLYEQRMILFAALVKAYKDKSWKSYRHEDGEYCFGGGWFIVGIDTPEGSYTYHYENRYWDMFDCVDLPRAKHWDGHTEADAETRLMSLEPEIKTDGDTISRQAAIETSLEFFVEFLGGAFYENSQKELIARFQRLPSAQPVARDIDVLSNDLISRQEAIDQLHQSYNLFDAERRLEDMPPVTPKQQWIPVTLETLPYTGSVVVVCGEKGTWDYGMYRGWHGDIHSWWWKKNSIKHVYWWMYKDDAMSLPYRKEGGE